jgi:DNA-binding MarR family transcriptional regulator
MPRPISTPDGALVAAVAANPGATAAAVAAALGIGHSSAQKRLAALEVAGQVRRDRGGRVDGVRAPDRWHPLDVDPAVAAQPATHHEEPAVPLAVAAEGRGRLERGALAAMVRAYLAERPKESFGPAALAKTLGRSPGAISNALAAMAERGEAVLVADKPRRYRIAR